MLDLFLDILGTTGKKFINFGNNTKTIYGKAKPKDIHKKINIIVGFDAIIEKPTAVPKNGALHGVASKVEKAPVRKLE